MAPPTPSPFPSQLRALVPALLLVPVLAGCGDGSGPDGTAASDPAPASSPTGTATPTAAPEPWRLVALVSGSDAGGRASTTAVRLEDANAVDDFAARLTRPSVARDLAEAAGSADVPAGGALYAAVVAVGCEVPPGVRVSVGSESVTITGTKATTPPVQCLVPVTTVALVSVPG